MLIPSGTPPFRKGRQNAVAIFGVGLRKRCFAFGLR